MWQVQYGCRWYNLKDEVSRELEVSTVPFVYSHWHESRNVYSHYAVNAESKLHVSMWTGKARWLRRVARKHYVS